MARSFGYLLAAIFFIFGLDQIHDFLLSLNNSESSQTADSFIFNIAIIFKFVALMLALTGLFLLRRYRQIWNELLFASKAGIELQQANLKLEETNSTFQKLVEEHNKTIEALKMSEERFRSLVESASDIFMIFDTERRFRYISPSINRVLGWNVPDFIEKRGRDFIHPDDLVKLREVFLEVAKEPGKEIDLVEFRVQDGYGKWRNIEAVFVNLLDNPFVKGVVVNGHDITERKIIEQELIAERDFATKVIQTMGQGLAIIDSERKLTYVNERLAHIFGYEPEELIGKPSTYFTLPEDLHILEEAREIRLQGKSNTYEGRAKKKDGSLIYVSVTGVPIIRDGKVTGAISVLTDLNERHKIEQELKAERDFATKVIQTMGQGLTVTDTDSKFTFINTPYANMLGYTPEELIGKTPFFITHPDDYTILEQARNKRRAGEIITYESRLQKRDGSSVYVTITGVPLIRNGESIGTIAVITDLTERRKAEEAEQQHSAYLEALHETALTLMNRLDLTELLDAIISRAGKLVGTEHGFIYLINDDEKMMTLRVGTGFYVDQMNLMLLPREGLSGKVWESGEMLAIKDYSKWDGRFYGTGWENPHAMVGIPLKSGGRVVGVIGLMRLEENRYFERDEVELLERFAQLAALALDNARLFGYSQRRLSELNTIQNIGQAINSNLQLREVFETAVNQIQQAFGYEMISVYLRINDKLILQSHSGFKEQTPFIVSTEQGIIGRVVRTGEAAFVNNVDQDKDFVRINSNTRQIIAVPLKSKENEILGGLSVASTGKTPLTEDDFTLLLLLSNQISTALENARLFTELGRSEEKYRDVVNNVKEVIFQTNLEGLLTFQNPAWADLFGYSLDESLNTHFQNYIYAEDLPNAMTEFSALLNKVKDSIQIELRLVSKNGGVHWSLAYARLQTTSEGEPLGIFGTLMDITERKRVEEERLSLERKMLESQKLESLGVMAGGIAHDFNNLLVSIMGNAELAQMDLPPDSPAAETIKQIELAAQRAADLTRQMLAYSGKGQFVMQQLDFNQVIDSMSELIKAPLNRKTNLEFNLAQNLPKIEADENQLRQLILNLIVNAAEAVGENEGFIKLTTQLVKADYNYLAKTLKRPDLQVGNYVLFEVTDSGSGMDEETLAKIFDPFFTTKFTGRGLGLSAVQGIVRGHKGTLHIESEVNKGTVFKVLLPCANISDATSPNNLSNGDRPKDDSRILIVDDDELLCKVTSRMLQKMGFSVLVASDGRAGVELYSENLNEIDCILLDLTMPNMNGEEALRRIRALKSTVRVVLMSGYDEKEAISRFGNNGAIDFLQKPYNSKELHEKIKKALNR